MTRDGGARAGIGRSVAHGLLSWGLLACAAAGILAARLHASQVDRAPLPSLVTRLTTAQSGQWKSFPSYHNMVPVLVYHSIGGKPSYITTTRMLFSEQMRAMKVAGFHTLTIQQYASYVRHGSRGLPSRPILITFDDGRLDAYRAADGLLRLYGFHATELVVPAWVGEHPNFSLSWTELRQMAHSGTWNVQEHFGYGREQVRTDRAGRTGGAFGSLQYIPGPEGQPGRLETFTQFQKRLMNNMNWGLRDLQLKIPGYKSYSMAIPESNYGQGGTNDLRIPPFTLSWLDRHYTVVFGGDYLYRTKGHKYQIPGRYSPRLSPRMSMGPHETLAGLYCRLFDYVRHVPIWKEYECLRLGPQQQQQQSPLQPEWQQFLRPRHWPLYLR